jgi:CBS domain-containing protein
LVGALAAVLGRAAGIVDRLPKLGSPAAPLCVRDVMTADPLVLAEDLTLPTAALLLSRLQVSGAPVVDAAGGLVGVVSEADLLAKEVLPPHGFGRAGAAAERRWQAVTVGEICSRPALVTAPDVTLHEAARLMQRRDVARLVVVADAKIVRILTRHDVLEALIRGDTALEQAVEATLVERGEPEVTAGVQWGVVKLGGAVGKRSRLWGLIQAVRALDGVVSVDDEQLGWLEDDVSPCPDPLIQPDRGGHGQQDALPMG